MDKKYIYTGLDFIFDENETPYFIEANSCPGLLRWDRVYGNFKPWERLLDYIKRLRCSTIAILTTRKKFAREKHRYFCNTLRKIFQKSLDVHICFVEDNEASLRKNSNKLKDRNNKSIEFDAIFMTLFLSYYRPNVLQINPTEIISIIRDKWLCYQIAKKSKEIKFPTTFLLSDRKKLKEIVSKPLFKKGIVLKPRRGEGGKGIFIFENPKEALSCTLKKEYLIQERIQVKKEDGKFWDVRAMVINGKFVGAIKRVSVNPVVNLSRGGEAERVSKKIERKIRKKAELFVKLVDRFNALAGI